MNIEEEISTFCIENHIPIVFLSNAESSTLVTELAKKFMFDIDRLFVWDTLTAVDWTDYSNGIEIWNVSLSKFLDKFQKEIFIVITDENFFPWPIFKCCKTDLIKILENVRFFEYFLFDSLQKQILFDTHDNSLMLCE